MKYCFCLALLLTSCASFKAHDPYRNPDGSLNVPKILRDISWGIEADCAIGTSALAQEICVYGREAVSAADAVTTHDPVLLKKSVAAILEQAAHEKPALSPYFDFGLKLLEAL